MVPAFANVRALGRLADRVQVQSPRQSFEIVVIVAHGSAGLQPLRLPLRAPGRKIDLDEFYRAGHLVLDVNLYCTMRGRPFAGVAPR